MTLFIVGVVCGVGLTLAVAAAFAAYVNRLEARSGDDDW